MKYRKKQTVNSATCRPDCLRQCFCLRRRLYVHPEALALEEQIFSSESSDSGADGFSDINEDSEENFISDDPFIDGSSSSSPEPLETEKELLEESIEEPPAENEEAKDPADKINDFSSQEETPFSSGEVLPKKNTDYILGRPMTPEEIQEQLSLMGNSPSFAPMNNADSCLDISMYAVPDPYYDSRESGIITPVKNQNPFNICGPLAWPQILRLLF